MSCVLNKGFWKEVRWNMLSEREKIRKLDAVIEKAKIERDEVERNIISRKVEIIKAYNEARDTVVDVKNIDGYLAEDLREKLEEEIAELMVLRRSIVDRIFVNEKRKMEMLERSTLKAQNSCGSTTSQKRREEPKIALNRLKKEAKGWSPFTSRPLTPDSIKPKEEKKPKDEKKPEKSPSAPPPGSETASSSGFGSGESTPDNSSFGGNSGGFGSNSGFGNTTGFGSDSNNSNTNNGNGQGNKKDEGLGGNNGGW